jgi:hypothetical protein
MNHHLLSYDPTLLPVRTSLLALATPVPYVFIAKAFTPYPLVTSFLFAVLATSVVIAKAFTPCLLVTSFLFAGSPCGSNSIDIRNPKNMIVFGAFRTPESKPLPACCCLEGNCFVLWNMATIANHLHGRMLRKSMFGDPFPVSTITHCQP